MICVTGGEDTPKALAERLDEACRRARLTAAGEDGDILAEVRLDLLDSPAAGLEVISRFSDRMQLLVTCRPSRQRGGYLGSERERVGMLGTALEKGAWAVDLELDTDPASRKDLLEARGRVVLSHHLFDPDWSEREVARILEEMAELGAEHSKLGVAVDDVCRLDPLRRAARKHPGRSLVVAPMGAAATIGRVLYRQLGSAWTYVCLHPGSQTASGQITLDEASAFGLTGEQAGRKKASPFPLLCLFGGSQVHSSFGPPVYNALFRKAGLPHVYLAAETRDLRGAVETLAPFGLAGGAVTMPHKEAAFGLADEVGPTAETLGAANTLVASTADGGQQWKALSTDGAGVAGALEPHCVAASSRVAVLGGGGAARAAALVLAQSGAEVTIYARRLEQAVNAASRLTEEADVCGGTVRAARWHEVESSRLDVLINATPVGTDEKSSPISRGELLEGKVVLDMVSWPMETPLLEKARRYGAKAAVPGLEMWVRQGIPQLAHWTGREFSSSEIRSELDSWLAGAFGPPRSSSEESRQSLTGEEPT
jgi:shikimate dehydrogenase